jgi:hypothetical protein
MSDPVGDLKRELLAAAERQQGRVAVSAGHRRLLARLAGKRLLLTSATLAVAAAATLLVTTPWSTSPGFLERAQAALMPPAGTILHYKSVGTLTSTDPACTVTRPIEIWIDQTRPHRYRALTNVESSADSTDGDLRAVVCSRGTPAELGGTLGRPEETLMFVPPDTLTSSRVGLGLPPDPVAWLRDAISAGTAHDEGKTQLDGRTVERIRIDPIACSADDPSCPSEPGYAYVDPETFYPVEFTGPGGIGPVGGRPVVWFHFVDRFQLFEYLPRTPANVALTDIRAQHPNATGP